ncbi:hypothetical protein A3Q35_04440 [Aeribacillus pallidus]|nr:hypothetical protein A3Q35_04440 [Aeribacillus pallidus]
MKWDERYFRSRKHHVDDAVLVEISKTADFYLLICKKNTNISILCILQIVETELGARGKIKFFL